MRIDFPAELPVSARRDDLEAAIRDHQVVVVAGETGSGKTTQLPKICLAMGRGSGGRLIGHTQPRRIAARSVAERIAEELHTELGDVVGYQVRFTDRTSAAGRVKVMTDGILLAELQHDRALDRYDTIIIDEAHERSLNIDFLLGYLKRLLPRRPDLKVVITSATIDPGRFAAHFADKAGRPAPVIEVSGRTYPVEIRYRPLVELPENDADGDVLVRDQTEAIVAAVDELRTETAGDILVFLPGEREIRDTADALASYTRGPRGYDVLPLFSRLSAAEQHRVFERHPRRRIVLATNVAETSLTVPGITAVIDTGVARISRYSTRTKVQRLPIEPISRASANQRSGRCGRTEAGIAIRLYSEEDFAGRPEFTDPEILRTTLASVILQMAWLRLGDVERFGFIDPPDRRAVQAGVTLLDELGALGPVRQGKARGLTRTGRTLARLPIDPQLGRMLVEADRRGVLRDVLLLAAALSIQDPRERPAEHRERADQLHARFRDTGSDFLTWLNLWRHVREQQRERGSSSFRRMCREEHLNYVRIREWQDLEAQLRQVCRQIGMRPERTNRRAATPDSTGHESRLDEAGIHQALLSGLLSHIGLRDVDRRDYLGARGSRFRIFPGSGLARKQPELVMAAELVETSHLWGRQVAAIDPAWAEELGAHLVKRTYAEPHWSKKRASVVAAERVTLYGVPLVADRSVAYGSIDPEASRELFIRHALVQREWHSRHRFLDHNARLLDEAAELEHKARRRDLVVDEETLFDFYDRVVPADVVSGAHFDAWWKVQRRETPHLLDFEPEQLLHDHAAEVTADDFPDEWREGEVALPLDYTFEPGSPDDGMRIEVPLTTLTSLGAAPFSWHVPGMRHELVVAWLRSLPKQLRVHVVPAPDVARQFLAAVPPGEEPLTEALARYLRATTGVHIPPEAWNPDRVPAHLQPRVRVLDEHGTTLAEGTDLDALRNRLRGTVETAVAEAAADSGHTTSGETAWVFGTIEPTVRLHRAGHEVLGHPALVDEGSSVGLRVFTDPGAQEAAHRRGVRRLLALTVPATDLARGLGNADKLALAGAPYPTVHEVLDDCVLAALDELVRPVWDETSFDALRAEATARLPDLAAATLATLLRVLAAAREIDAALQGRVDLAVLPSMTDMRAHLDRLVHRGFVAEAGVHLRDHVRYLRALGERRMRLDDDPGRDRTLMAEVEWFQSSWQQRMDALPVGHWPSPRLEELRWAIEEFRVSRWAQRVGTAHPISAERLRRLVAALG